MMHRRSANRVPLDTVVMQYNGEREERALAVDLSEGGLYYTRERRPMWRYGSIVQLEFALPGTSEVIWAAAEPRHDRLTRVVHDTGVRFTAMARAHRRLLRDYVMERRLRLLHEALAWLREQRSLPRPSPA